MSFPSAVRTCLRKYAHVEGRARPAEFWWFILFVVTAWVIARAIDAALGTETRGYGLVASALLLLLLVPLLAAGARRLHDCGLSGWWLLLVLVPCGNVALLFYFIRGSQGDNRYGPSPLGPVGPA